MTGERVSASVIEDASAFLDPKYTIDDLYEVLGMQLDAVEALDKPKSFGRYMMLTVDRAETETDFIRKGRDFLAKWWDKIVENACAWWKDNRDKVGDKLVAGLAIAIAPAIPAPWGWIAGIIVVAAMIVIKAGLDAVCEKKPAKKP